MGFLRKKLVRSLLVSAFAGLLFVGVEGDAPVAEAQGVGLVGFANWATLKKGYESVAFWTSEKKFGKEAATTDDVVGCWVSGPLGVAGDGSWGAGHEDFAADIEDVQEYVVERSQYGFEIAPQGHSRFFRTVPELVDYTFGLDVSGTGDLVSLAGVDGRVAELQKLWTGKDAGVRELPWATGADYRARRPVAGWAGNRLVSVETRWRDVDNPGGGTLVDHGEIARDAIAAQADLSVATTTMKGEGGETSFRQEQTPVLLLDGEGRLRCTGSDGATTCKADQEVETTADVIESRGISYEVNTNEIEERNVGRGERPVVLDESLEVVTVEVDTRALTPAQIVRRSKSVLGYGREGARDTADTTLDVYIRLERDLREDFAWDALNNGDSWGMVGRFGEDPMTYERFILGRDWRLNAPKGGLWSDKLPEDGAGGDGEANIGYRQPMLNRAKGVVAGGGDVHGHMEHLKWPVNLEDLNWYLYRIPDAPQEGQWYYWLTRAGGRALAWSGYGGSAAPDEFSAPCKAVGVANEQHNIECDGKEEVPELGNPLPNWAEGDGSGFADGTVEGVFFPFDVTGGAGAGPEEGLRRELLVRAGVASAEDAGGGEGTRRLSDFRFAISEGDDLRTAEEEGVGLARLGIPEKKGLRRAAIKEWPEGEVNPNRVYLLVVTFYEVRHEGRSDAVRFAYAKRGVEGVVDGKSGVYVPKKDVRRVVCRIVVRNAGFEATGVAGTTAMEWLSEKVSDMLTDVGGDIKRLVADGARGIMKSPPWAGRKVADVECAGMDRLDELTTGGARTYDEVRKSGPGELVVNQAVVGRHNGIENCERVREEKSVSCDAAEEFVFEGKCTVLPKMEMEVRDGWFLDLKEAVHYNRYEWGYLDENGRLVPHGYATPVLHASQFSPTYDPTGPERPNERNRGLSRLYVRWGPKWQGVDGGLMRQIGGWKLTVIPDQRVMDTVVPAEGMVFYLPRRIRVESTIEGGGQTVTEASYQEVNGFHFGGLGKDERGEDRGGSALWEAPAVAEGDEAPEYSIKAVGGTAMNGEYLRFEKFIKRLPLTPGFEHSFRVVPFVGEFGTSNYFEGTTVSDQLVLDGATAACYTRTDMPSSIPGEMLVHEKVVPIYGCRGVESLSFPPEERTRFGLLSLVGTEACGDIFSSTPPEFTWDNGIVKNVWVLMVVIGGAVLFTLFVWQGLRMTYDVWLDPQPAVGMREMVPRFLLAVVLMAGSLAICEIVLVLASDLTCVVAQATGMTMWGFLGTTIGEMLLGFVVWMEVFVESFDGLFLHTLLGYGLILFLLACVIVVFIILVLILFLMVAFAMLTRIALLAVLVAFAPLAFAFYASNVTSHWTKLWVTMFLGTTFQQVVILVVVFLGGHILGEYLRAGAEGEFDVLVIGMILAALTLVLALKVPSIVNPRGQGMFESFRQVGMMAVAGATMVGGLGIGAAAGAFGGVGGAAAGAARSGGTRMSLGGGGRGRGQSDGGDGDGGAAGGGVPVGGGPAPGGGGQGMGGMSSGGFPGGSGSTAGTTGGRSGGGAPTSQAGEEGSRRTGFLQRTYRGARMGARRAGGVNTRLADLTSGGFLFRGGSTADDSALELGRLREEQAQRAETQSAAYDRMADVLDKLNQRLP